MGSRDCRETQRTVARLLMLRQSSRVDPLPEDPAAGACGAGAVVVPRTEHRLPAVSRRTNLPATQSGHPERWPLFLCAPTKLLFQQLEHYAVAPGFASHGGVGSGLGSLRQSCGSATATDQRQRGTDVRQATRQAARPERHPRGSSHLSVAVPASCSSPREVHPPPVAAGLRNRGLLRCAWRRKRSLTAAVDSPVGPAYPWLHRPSAATKK